jgi:hypothetical protein
VGGLSTAPLHILPVGDLIEHERDEGCVCGPIETVLHRADGSDTRAFSHMSLDGREHRRAAP